MQLSVQFYEKLNPKDSIDDSISDVEKVLIEMGQFSCITRITEEHCMSWSKININ